MIHRCPHCRVQVDRNQKNCPTCRRLMIRRCTACAEDISVLASLCKYCGEAVEPIRGPIPVAAPPPPAPAPEIEFVDEVRSVRWENPASGGRLARWWTTWGSSMAGPGDFWRKMPLEGGHRRPISYAWYPVAQLLTVLLPFVLLGTAMACDTWFTNIRVHETIWAGAIYLLLYPLTYVAVALGTWITAIFWHVPLKILGGKGNFEGTVRTVAYNSGAQIWHLVPVAGTIVAFVMGTVLNYHAFRNVHSLSKGRAAFAAILPILLGVLLVGGLIALAASGCIDADRCVRIHHW